MLLSVIIPAYNAEPYIVQSLRSLLNQQGDFELDICVVEDGSTDDTVEIVRTWTQIDPRIRLFTGQHAGVSAARNRGLENLHSNTQFVTFQDADDIASPGRIMRQLGQLQADAELQSVYGLLQLFDVLDDRTLLPSVESRTAVWRGISLSAGLYRRSFVDKIGRFDVTLTQAEDLDFLFRIIETGEDVHLDDQVATFYRRHDTNTTNDRQTGRREFMKAIHKSIKRRRAANGSSLPSLDASMFTDRSQLEEEFCLCPSNTAS